MNIQLVLTPEEEQVIIERFVKDDYIAVLPVRDKKIIPVLRWVANHFETDRQYREKEVNETLLPLCPDPVIMRRMLIAYHFMDRKIDGSAYWRTEPDSVNQES